MAWICILQLSEKLFTFPKHTMEVDDTEQTCLRPFIGTLAQELALTNSEYKKIGFCLP